MPSACRRQVERDIGQHPDLLGDLPFPWAGLGWTRRVDGHFRAARRARRESARSPRSSTRSSREARRGGVRRRARDRQVAPARRARGRADARGQLVLSGSGVRAREDVPFWVFVDALEEYLRGPRSRTAGVARRGRPDGARPRLPGSSAGARGRARCSTSATAPTAPCAALLEALRRPARSCWCSTTSTGPTRPRSSWSARCSSGCRPRRCCSRSVRGRGTAGAAVGLVRRAQRAGTLSCTSWRR